MHCGGLMVRLVSDPATGRYMERRTKEGKSKLGTIGASSVR